MDREREEQEHWQRVEREDELREEEQRRRREKYEEEKKAKRESKSKQKEDKKDAKLKSKEAKWRVFDEKWEALEKQSEPRRRGKRCARSCCAGTRTSSLLNGKTTYTKRTGKKSSTE